MSRDSNSASNLVYFLLGAAVGAAAALLYAPREGAETRRLISQKAQDVRAKAGEVSDTVTDAAREKWDTVSEKARELLHKEGVSVNGADQDEFASTAGEPEPLDTGRTLDHPSGA